MKKKVLIIEDSDDTGIALKQLIELEGYEAIWVNRAVKGRDLAFTSQPDLIVLDARLPDEDGLQLARELRNAPETNNIPILCVSSYVGGMKMEAFDAGCREVFSKATFMESYPEILRKYLGEPAILLDAQPVEAT